MSETPFKIDIPDSEINLLRQKLELARLPDELEEAGWAYGVPLADVKRLVDKWRATFDWKKHEAEINKLPMFTRDIEIDGFGSLNIHYVHQKRPGHFLEVEKILPLLADSSPDYPSFHVVAFSLPGFGFSETAKKKGFSINQYSETGHKLMLALGYPEYVVQGGDWGGIISRRQSSMYAHKHVKAWHTNFPFVAGPPKLFSHPRSYLTHLVKPYTAREKAGIARRQWFAERGRGYFAEQSTQPQTIGYSLADSPVGLLTWIYEKLVNWTDDYPWDDDEVLQWVSVYWFSRSGPAASVRIYYESVASNDFYQSGATSVPLGISYFPKEMSLSPRSWSKTIGNVVFESEHESGGHFAAHEKPVDLVSDLRKMFGKGGPAYGVVSGKNGYAIP
ncbi:hypothetical protein NLI96_g11710 [Meripilus lineatus]|uniref:Epoxide hydrolase N-terminal domain-containing protein n=1 Tax=Meripilus lineatus TaxID=2056292 RepID=A0AAD5UTQ6_9APHY|nr:hypothetical protein NLI96_g11710 [Physisporinus lineatus]